MKTIRKKIFTIGLIAFILINLSTPAWALTTTLFDGTEDLLQYSTDDIRDIGYNITNFDIEKKPLDFYEELQSLNQSGKATVLEYPYMDITAIEIEAVGTKTEMTVRFNTLNLTKALSNASNEIYFIYYAYLEDRDEEFTITAEILANNYSVNFEYEGKLYRELDRVDNFFRMDLPDNLFPENYEFARNSIVILYTKDVKKLVLDIIYVENTLWEVLFPILILIAVAGGLLGILYLYNRRRSLRSGERIKKEKEKKPREKRKDKK